MANDPAEGREPHDDQEVAESLDDETLGDEVLQIDGLRAHDLDLVDSLRDRADREEPDFDHRPPRSDHTAQQLVELRHASADPQPDMLARELPGDGDQCAEEAAVHLEDEMGHAI